MNENGRQLGPRADSLDRDLKGSNLYAFCSARVQGTSVQVIVRIYG